MGVEDYTQLVVEALYLALYVSAPVLAAALVVGVVVAIGSAATQVQEQTLTFVPKLVAVSLVLTVAGGWMAAELLRFTDELWRAIPALVS